jgi:hypothetical protein
LETEDLLLRFHVNFGMLVVTASREDNARMRRIRVDVGALVVGNFATALESVFELDVKE